MPDTQSFSADITAEFARLYPAAWARQAIPADELALLAQAAMGNGNQFRRFLKRRLHGDPVAYILGHVTFAGRRFTMDRRAYVTDPETVHLVGAVRQWASPRQGPLYAAEVGVGAGALAITLLLEVPDLRITGLELDDAAAALCRENAAHHGVALDVVESDLFAAWGDRPAPDLIYGDLPWGDDTTLYGQDRDADHYHRMPPTTAFPLSGRTGAHQDLIMAVRDRGWAAHILLNCGTLPDGDIADVVAAARDMQARLLSPAATARILHLFPL
ncbi:methyltransferase [Niveispirillum irakense]|uniref:methyltransferase n=1 Tax=Niveispirillum irakense TaxID=34011 RepID=UPI000491D216|nr:methyltransferase [Niveispirillum irakense]